MSRSSKPLIILLFIFIFTVFITSVQAEYDFSVLRLPADSGGDLCARSAPPVSCPVTCFTTDPVCGVNGVTYWCGCTDAICAGTKVAKLGFCEVGNGGSGSMSGQALLLVHIVWLILLGFSVLLGLL